MILDGELFVAFSDASRFLVESVELVDDASWEAPGLGDWSVRELVAHANRGQTTVEEYLLRPQAPADAAYFSEGAIAARARDSVTALGAQPLAAVRAASQTVIALVQSSPPGRRIGSPAGTMTLAEYLPSRIAELTTHGLDIRLAVGADLETPDTAIAASLAHFSRLAVRKKSGQDVLLAITGRRPLPDDYSLV